MRPRIELTTLSPEWLASWLFEKEGEAVNPYAKGTEEHARFARELEKLELEELNNAACCTQTESV